MYIIEWRATGLDCNMTLMAVGTRVSVIETILMLERSTYCKDWHIHGHALCDFGLSEHSFIKYNNPSE